LMFWTKEKGGGSHSNQRQRLFQPEVDIHR
jgi:hypothetical protein